MNSINLKIITLTATFVVLFCNINNHSMAQNGAPQNTTQTLATNNQTIDQTNNQTNDQPRTQAAPTLPKFMILPWHTPLVDADALQKTKAAREMILVQLQNNFAPNALPLETFVPPHPTLTTLKPMLRGIVADNTKSNLNPIAIFPLWTRVHDYDLFALVVIDATANTINALRHRIVPHSEWQTVVLSKNFENFFAPRFNELSKSLNIFEQPIISQDLAVALRDQTASIRSNEVDRATISALLFFPAQDENNPPSFVLLNPFHLELLTAIQKIFLNKPQMRKANREVITRMTYDKPFQNKTLPLTIDLNIRATDAVFGQTLPWNWSEPLTLSANSTNTLDIKISERLLTQLRQEKETLRRDELPQVAKIVGAWAYMDKGRAWGLQMNDRLISNENPSKIKGHVVSYFGPELHLKSPRGWPIHEGAIVFIRKGQKSIKIGETLTYDGMKVPTPWPPASSAAKQ